MDSVVRRAEFAREDSSKVLQILESKFLKEL